MSGAGHITAEQYERLQTAFDFFNGKLFGGKLPEVFFTVARHRGAAGYFRPDGFQQRLIDPATGAQLPPGFTVHEIALMPDAMYNHPDREVFQTIVHEMCHLQQQEQGSPSRNGYHNHEFANMMKAVGLQASSMGNMDSRNPYRKEPAEEGAAEGAATGQKMADYIIADGPFDHAWRELVESGFTFLLHAVPTTKQKPPKSKFKFTCPICGARVWAKTGTPVICGQPKCMVRMVEEPAEQPGVMPE